MADEPTEDMVALRAEYEAALGKKPFPGWDAAALREKIAAAPPRDLGPPTKTISLTGDHVHMPEDLLTPGWKTCQTTKRYDAKNKGEKGRIKYLVHADLADFLIGRDQAMEVVPDEDTEG